MKSPWLLACGCIVSLFAARYSAANEFRTIWVSRYDSPVPVSAPGRRVVTDALGNIIVAAEVIAGNGKLTPGIAKYDPNGELLWTRDLRDTALWSASRMLLAVDGEGSIHAAFSHIPAGASDSNASDIRTLLYDADGQVLWQADHGEPTSYDSVNALVVDAAGDTVVTGSDGGKGWITIRYDRTGTSVWTARHPGRLDRFFSYAWALAMNEAGDVYVLGQLDAELVALRYDATGKIVWVSKAGEGVPGAIGLDQSGAVYVSGTLQEDNQKRFAILKYDARGSALWKLLQPAVGEDNVTLTMTVPPAGGVYAALVHTDTGLGSGDSLLVLAVDPEGRKLWQASEPSGSAVDIAHDSDGNLLVLGWTQGAQFDFTTSKYSPDGRKLWSASQDGPGDAGEEVDDFPFDLTVDKDGDVVVVGYLAFSGRQRRGVALKYGTDGQQRWLVEIPGVGGLTDLVRTLAVDDEGNSYVVGIGANETKRDIVVIQNLPDGKQGWVSGLATPGVFRDAKAARLDPEGNLIVCGSTSTPPEHTTVALLFKLDRGGSIVWQATHGDVRQGDSRSNDLALAEAGNTYITGTSFNGQNGQDWATVKFDAAGKKLWTASEHGGDDDEAVAVAVSPDGRIQVTGRTGTRDRSSAYYTTSYAADGRKLWAASFGEPDLFSAATALALAPDGGVHVTGTVIRPSISQPEYATIRYDRDGKQLWVTHSGGPQTNCCGAPTLVVDAAGNAFVTGNGGLTQKYSRDGILLWGTLQPNLDGRAIALDRAGGVFVAGTLDTLESRTDFFVIQYDENGKTVATASQAAPASTAYKLEAMAIDREGDILVAGSTGSLLEPSDFLTLKLRKEDALFERGDANQDGRFDISDGIAIISALFRGAAQPRCEQSADLNADGRVSLSDALYCIAHQLLGGSAPAQPFPDCGKEAFPSGLRCASFRCR